MDAPARRRARGCGARAGGLRPGLRQPPHREGRSRCRRPRLRRRPRKPGRASPARPARLPTAASTATLHFYRISDVWVQAWQSAQCCREHSGPEQPAGQRYTTLDVVCGQLDPTGCVESTGLIKAQYDEGTAGTRITVATLPARIELGRHSHRLSHHVFFDRCDPLAYFLFKVLFCIPTN